MLAGNYSEASDGFAVGVTLLVALSGCSCTGFEDIEELIEEANDDRRFEEIAAEDLADHGIRMLKRSAQGVAGGRHVEARPQPITNCGRKPIKKGKSCFLEAF